MLNKLSKCIHFSLCLLISLMFLFFQYGSTAPVEITESMFAQFINEMKSKKCATPEQIQLPLNTTAAGDFEYMSSSLKICQTPETSKRSKEANYLCKEILDILKVIMCPRHSTVIINQNLTLSNQVCKDIGSLKNTVQDDKVMLKRLTDSFLCDMMCDAEFEKACQVLLWSYLVQKHIENAQALEKKVNGENPPQHKIQPNSGNPNVQGGSDKPKEEVQEMSQTTQELKTKGSLKPPSSNMLIPDTQTPKMQLNIEGESQQAVTNKLLSQNQTIKTHTTEFKLNKKNTVPGLTKDASANQIVSLYRDNDAGNNPLNVGSEVQEDEVNGNELPEAGNESVNTGIQEEPHDNEELIPHIEESGNPNTNKLTVNPHANEDFVDPHDKEINALHPKIEGAKTNQKVSVIETDQGLNEISNNHLEVPADGANQDTDTKDNPNDFVNPNLNEAKSQTQVKTTTQDGTTKEDSTTGADKNPAAITDKKVEVDSKSSVAGKVSLSKDDQKTIENPSSVPPKKEAVIEVSSVALPTSEDSSTLVVTTVALEKMEEEDDAHEPEDKEPDQYTDLENTEGDPEDEYSRQDYDGGFYEPVKSKETKPDKPNKFEFSKIDVAEEKEQTFNEFSSRDKYGHEPENIPIMAVFPEQEDSHFFFYFLSIVLILMAGYLIFHNKQKIIALIVEGRHERRRRSHGVGYKKLETK